MKFVDYIAAGQDRGTGAVFMTLMATMLGASATLGVAARAETMGFPAVWWLLSGALGLALQAWLLAGRIRDTGARTLPELAGHVAGPPARRLVAGVIAVAWPGVVGAQFAAAGGLLGTLLGTEAVVWPVLASAAVVILYTLAGGQRAVVKSDAWQLAVLAIGFGGLFAWVFGGRCGGDPVPREAVRLLSDGFGPRDAVLSVLTVGGAYFLGPDIASRALVARNGRTARRAVLWASPALAIFAVGIVLAGMWAAANAPGAGNPVYRIAERLPTAIRWCLAAGLVAALMSSADTCLMNAAAIAAYDLAGRKSVGAVRVAVGAVGVAATGLALVGGDIIGILLKAYSVYVPGVVCPLAVAIVAGGVRRKEWWLAAVAAGGACGLAGACWPTGEVLPAAGMGISLLLALAAVFPGRGFGKGRTPSRPRE